MRSGALGGPATAPAPALGPFYRLRVTVDAGPAESVSWSAWYVPDPGRVTGGDPSAPGWLAVQAPGRRALERLAARVEPHPTPELIQVLVRRRPADDPAAYARLFGAREAALPVPAAGDWLPVSTRTERPSPWTARMTYSPRHDLLYGGGAASRVPPGLARRLEREGAIVAAAPGREAEVARPVAAAGMALVLGLALAGRGAAGRRRRAGDA
jgi:hypothetical protein